MYTPDISSRAKQLAIELTLKENSLAAGFMYFEFASYG